jgi:hypothetical protein
MPNPNEITEDAVRKLEKHVPAFRDLTGPTRDCVTGIIREAITRQYLRDIHQVWNYDGQEPREALLEWVDPNDITKDIRGNAVTSNTDANHWREWCPGLDNAHLALGEVMGSLPGVSADEVRALVCVFEKPAAPLL